MCIAIYLPAGKELSEETLKICNDANPDGMGFAFFNDKNEMIINKEVEPKKILRKIKLFPIIRKNFINRPFLVHFRIATHGKISKPCCHPFRVDSDTVFCHNGILRQEYGLSIQSKISDTMMFNKSILQRIEKKDLDRMMESKNDVLRDLLEGYIGSGNKMVILNSKDQYVILNEHLGVWDNGIWFSNSSYKVIRYTQPAKYWQQSWYDPKTKTWKGWGTDW